MYKFEISYDGGAVWMVVKSYPSKKEAAEAAFREAARTGPDAAGTKTRVTFNGEIAKTNGVPLTWTNGA